MNYKENDAVLCTVENITKTNVFVKIQDNGEGTIIISEIAPGRIRNIREYVVPGKKIVCKILRIDQSGNIYLSLRRVNSKEKKQVLEQYEKEKSAQSILKSILKESSEEIIKKIKQEHENLSEFLKKSKENPEILEKYISKQEAEKILKILREKKEKQVEVKKEFLLTSKSSNGLEIIKTALLKYKNQIIYLGAGKYSIKIISQDYKQANQQVQDILKHIEKEAEKNKAEFKIKEK